jgi:hypothetical protein
VPVALLAVASVPAPIVASVVPSIVEAVVALPAASGADATWPALPGPGGGELPQAMEKPTNPMTAAVKRMMARGLYQGPMVNT